MKELLQRYLETRISLDDPEVVLAGMSRSDALRAARRLALGGRRRPGSRATGASASEPKAAPRASAKRAADAGDPSTPRPGAPAPASAWEGEVELREEEIARLRSEADAAELRVLPNLATLRGVAVGCTRCGLQAGRRNVVFGEGSPGARVVCVGEAPGAKEDETGRPFVGRAGQLLDRLLLTAGFAREEVYICNVLKCRPPGNRDPRPEEIEACSPYLLRQLELIDPEVIVAFGTFAARTLLEARESLGRLRGRTHLYAGYPVVVTYHPAALLRNPGWTRPTWEDLQRARRIVEEGGGRVAARTGPAQGGLFG